MKVDIFNLNKRYAIIYADPPWEYNKRNNIKTKFGKGAGGHYPTMKQKDIEALPVGKLAEDNAILFIWATFPKLQEALNTIKAWGFEYKTIGFNWVKKTRGGAISLGLAGTQNQMQKYV